MGGFIAADANNFSGAWRSYMRIRVSIDITKPLKRKMKIKKQGGAATWANFKYEKLPNFCFFCGLIGHSDRFCEKFFDYPDKSVEKLFGTWLRASAKPNPSNAAARWLRSCPAAGHTTHDGEEERIPEKGETVIAGKFINHATTNFAMQRKDRDMGGNKDVGGNKDDQGTVGVSNLFDSVTNDAVGHLNGPSTLIITDPKRRRTNNDIADMLGHKQLGQDFMEEENRDTIIGQGMKHPVEAGSGNQTRRAL